MIYIILPVLVTLSAFFTWIYHAWQETSKYDHIPGPKPEFFWGNTRAINPVQPHLALYKWHEKYGPIIKIHSHTGVTVSAGSFEAINEILTIKGKDFGGRAHRFLGRSFFRDGGIGLLDTTNKRYKVLKMTAFKQIKPYGEGRRVMDNIVEEVTEKSFRELEALANTPFDPFKLVFRMAQKTVGFFLFKEYIPDDHRLFDLTYALGQKASTVLGTFGPGEIIDRFPWLLRFHSTWPTMQEIDVLINEFHSIIKKHLKNDPYKSTYPQLLESFAKTGTSVGKSGTTVKLTEADVLSSSMEFLVSGASTTSFTFYNYIAIIKQRPDIQKKLYCEISKFLGKHELANLEDRYKMPYAYATLLEMNRYVTVGKLSVPHRALVDTSISGYFIPKGTRVITNLWRLHHDKEFWGDPDVFRPERFLNEDGELLPVDHPTRRHVQMFGGGPRVCPGETLAMTRMFVWIVTLTQRFEIKDAGTAKEVSAGLLNRPIESLVILLPRDQ